MILSPDSNQFQTILLLPYWVIVAFITAIGALIGSFLNVVIHRVPRHESIVFPNSRCPSCGVAIHSYDNVPILSYLVLRGRCRACKTRISPRYPAVEALTAILFCGVALTRGITLALPFDLVFVAAILALLFIDSEFMILPNRITYPGIVFALIARIAIPSLTSAFYLDDYISVSEHLPNSWSVWMVSLAGAILGALAGGGSLWLIGWIWERVRKVEAMGLGDVKMMFMVGAFLGWRLALLTIFLGVLSGSVAGIGIMIKKGEKDLSMMLPFGIFLGIGSLASLMFGSLLLRWYLSKF